MASDEADELASFNAEYRRDLPERLREIDALWSELLQEGAKRERMQAMLRGLHSIAGSAGTFGLPQVSAAAAAAEAFAEPFCRRGTMPEAADIRRFNELLSELRQAAA